MELSPSINILTGVSAAEAVNLQARDLEPEHILLGLLKIEDLLQGEKPVAEMSDGDWDEARHEIAQLVDFYKQKKIAGKALRRRLRRLWLDQGKAGGEFSGHRTDDCRKLFERAAFVAQERGDEKVGLIAFWAACRFFTCSPRQACCLWPSSAAALSC